MTGRRPYNNTAEYTACLVTKQVVDKTTVNLTCILMVDMVWTESVAAMTVKTNTNLQAAAYMNTCNGGNVLLTKLPFIKQHATLQSPALDERICYICCAGLRQHDLKSQGPAHSDTCS